MKGGGGGRRFDLGEKEGAEVEQVPNFSYNSSFGLPLFQFPAVLNPLAVAACVNGQVSDLEQLCFEFRSFFYRKNRNMF